MKSARILLIAVGYCIVASVLHEANAFSIIDDPSLLLAGASIAIRKQLLGSVASSVKVVGAWGAAVASAKRFGDMNINHVIRSEIDDEVKEDVKTDYVQFVSPLLQDGYPPAVEYATWLQQQTQSQSIATDTDSTRRKPLLLYLPGFDGTILAPFLQFPSLGDEFDVRAMKIDEMDDRSTFVELKEKVVEYLLTECKRTSNEEVYLFGESFGGILAIELAMELNKPKYKDEYNIDLKGLVLVNPATSYLRSALYNLCPPIANEEPLLPAFENVQYMHDLCSKVAPIFFGHEKRFIQQLMGICTFKGLPPVVNSAQKEAYMGRVAFALPSRLRYMPKDTLKWRLEEWLAGGCRVFNKRLDMLRTAERNDKDLDEDTQSMLNISNDLPTVIVAGELDALPSVDEAEMLASEVFHNAHLHVVPGAGHISTCGGSLNLIQVMRQAFPEINSKKQSSSDESEGPLEELAGLEPRYDKSWIGMPPWAYWDEDNYRELRAE